MEDERRAHEVQAIGGNFRAIDAMALFDIDFVK